MVPRPGFGDVPKKGSGSVSHAAASGWEMVFVSERDPGVGVSSFLPPHPPIQRAPGEKHPENRRVLPLGWLRAGRGDGWLCHCCPLVHAAAGSPGSPAAPAQSLGCWGMLAAAGRLLASSVAFCPVKIILKLVLLAGRKYALPCPAHISASLASGLCLGSGCAPAPGVWKQQKPGRFGSSSCTQTFCPYPRTSRLRGV